MNSALIKLKLHVDRSSQWPTVASEHLSLQLMRRLIVEDVDVPGFKVCWPILEDHIARSKILVKDFTADVILSDALLIMDKAR